MTDEEINRKFGVVAGHLATLAAGLQTLTEKVDRTAGSIINLLAIAEIQAAEIKDLSESVRTLADRQRASEERGRRTDERLDALINIVERHISEGRDRRA